LPDVCARRNRPDERSPRRQLCGPELRTLADYFERCDRLRATLAPHVVGLLRAGISVVLDFHANTIRSRRWMRTLFEDAEASHQLHFLDVPDEVCRARNTRRGPPEVMASATPNSTMSPVSSSRPSQAKDST
jgi:predicted kinase